MFKTYSFNKYNRKAFYKFKIVFFILYLAKCNFESFDDNC